jgi:formylglycine-generating enzyme required for sulfatase activity
MDPDGDELEDAFEDFIDEYGYTPGNRLLFFFTGHGHSREDGMGYLVPADAPDPRKDQGGFYRRVLSMSRIMTWCREMTATHALFLFDSCFSGTIFKAKDLPEVPPDISALAAKPVRQFISAGGAGESVPAQSVFAPSFVKALRGEADLIKDGFVTGTELGMYLQNKVIHYNPHQTPQYGKIKDPRLDEGDFVFKLAQFEKHSEKVRLNVYTEPSDARVLILNIGPKFYQGMELSPGEYDLEVSAAEYETHREWIHLSAGEDKEVTIRLEHSGPEERFTNSLDMEFVYLKPGSFTMGSSESEKGRDDDETQHKVKLSQGFYMGRTEVTVGQFRQFITATGYETEAETDGGAYVWTGEEWKKKAEHYWDNPGFDQADDHPVTCVSWNDAQKFIEWLNRQEDQQSRLPTEAEWEYAARAGSTTARYWGDNSDSACRYANVADKTAAKELSWAGVHDCEDGYVYTAPVGTYRPNESGLHDMIGNVWEWCQDWYGDYPAGSVTDPQGPSSGGNRVLRGGSWGSVPRYCRSANRYWYGPATRRSYSGFRLVAPLVSR